MAKKKNFETFFYECNITNERFKTTREAPNPENLMSVKAYYEMNPEQDDRPDEIKKQVDSEGN